MAKLPISAIVLAAGFASRMKQSKLSLPFKEHTIIEEVLHHISASNVKEVIVVTGSHQESVEPLIKEHKKVKCIFNEGYEKGLTSSIQKGLQSICSDAKSVLIGLADMPLIQTNDYNYIINTYEQFFTGEPLIVRPFVNDLPAHPIIFSDHFFEELLALKNTEGAKTIVKENSKFLKKVNVANHNFFFDIDNRQDYESLLSQNQDS